MESNPYKSPQSPSEPSAAEKERNQRRVLFVFLGAVTLFAWMISTVVCVYLAEVGGMLGFIPIGLLGAFTVWHAVNPSKYSVRCLIAALVLLTIEFIVLATILN